MFQNKQFWKVASIIISTTLLMAVMPEVRILGLFIEVMGIDMLLMVVGGYFLFPLKWLYFKIIRPVPYFINSFFEKKDSYYFFAKGKNVVECPQLMFHAVPFLVGGLFWATYNGWLYA